MQPQRGGPDLTIRDLRYEIDRSESRDETYGIVQKAVPYPHPCLTKGIEACLLEPAGYGYAVNESEEKENEDDVHHDGLG
jgi:hypothetical protein